ncbi:MAG: hypothetical protein WC455_25895 [Dehalococcoidia bacterium]|jgi:hypothetical protein
MCDNCGWEELLERIDDLLSDGDCDFAHETLEGFQFWVEAKEHCTDRQREAVENIANSLITSGASGGSPKKEMKMATTIVTLRDLWETIGDCNAGVVRNDRGNGSAGPAYIDAATVADCADIPLRPVGEDEDEEAWELARHAHQSLRLDPPTIVCTGEEQHPAGEYLSSNPYQAIYSV